MASSLEFCGEHFLEVSLSKKKQTQRCRTDVAVTVLQYHLVIGIADSTGRMIHAETRYPGSRNVRGKKPRMGADREGFLDYSLGTHLVLNTVKAQ